MEQEKRKESEKRERETKAQGMKESEKDAELRHLLVTPLIERSMAKRLLTGEALNRTLLDTLIQHSMKMSAGTAAGSSA